jgi:tetratricopeptide (TPR) repeat protein
VSDPNDPLRNPAYEAPAGPDGPQIPEAELDAALAEAAQYAQAGNVPEQRNVLRKCANKTPISARCDGAMGLSMIAVKNRKAAALYHLLNAAGVDDPKADAKLYADVGEALRAHGKLEQAIAALRLAVAREPSAAYSFALGQALSLTPDHLLEAADRMAEARAKDDRVEWLYEEAVVRGQIPAREQAEAATALFRQYAARVPNEAAKLDTRIAELEQLIKLYPSQAEWERRRAAAQAEQAEQAQTKPESEKGPN